MAKIKPLPRRIIIEIVTRSESLREEAASSGILLPDAKYEGAPIEGVVYAVGSDVDPEIQPGQHVYFKEDLPKGFRLDGRPLLGIWAEQVLGVAV